MILPDIFLKSFPVRPGELKDKLFIISEEDGGLSVEHITSLRRYEFRPKKPPSKMLKSRKNTAVLTRKVQMPEKLELIWLQGRESRLWTERRTETDH